RFGKRRRWRDRIPRRDRRAAVQAAKRRCAVAVDEDALADGIAWGNANRQRAGKVRERVIATHVPRLAVAVEQRFLALVLLAEELVDLVRRDVEQRRQRAAIGDGLEQLALPRIGVLGVADRGERNAEWSDVVAKARRRQRLGRVVEEI